MTSRITALPVGRRDRATAATHPSSPGIVLTPCRGCRRPARLTGGEPCAMSIVGTQRQQDMPRLAVEVVGVDRSDALIVDRVEQVVDRHERAKLLTEAPADLGAGNGERVLLADSRHSGAQDAALPVDTGRHEGSAPCRRLVAGVELVLVAGGEDVEDRTRLRRGSDLVLGLDV